MKELKQIAVGLALMLAISAPVIAQTVIGAGGARAGRGQGRGQGARGGGLATMPVATLSYFVTLKDDQKTGATALVKNLQLLQSLRIPFQTYSDLKITDEQKTKLTALAADVQKDRTAKMQEMQAARQAGDNEKAQQIMQSMFGNGQPDEKTLAVLTADQKEVITKYVKANPPRQGGRPGGFGPGAGAAPQP